MLPGVAIAISLVPPLAVVGVCLGKGDVLLALGAGVLFLSNLLAMVLTGSLVYAVLGQGEAQSRLRRSRAVSRGASRGRQLSRPTTLLVSEAAPK